MFSVILLAAGESKRFGSPKALAGIYGTPAIQLLTRTLLESVADEIIVVLGAQAQHIEPSVFKHSRVRIVYNKDHFLGQTSSFQVGLAAASKACEGFLLMPVDCPLIKSSTVDTLCLHFNKTKPSALIPTYQQHKGHPPVFDQNSRELMMELPTDCGINSIYASAGFRLETTEINDPGITTTFNTPAELKKVTE